MKKLLSTSYSEVAFNIAILIMRATLGAMMCLNHGIPKFSNFSDLQHNFFDPFNIGHKWSLMLSIFAELVASMFVVLGFFTRIAAFILMIDLFVAVFMFHKDQPVRIAEGAIIFLTGYFAIFLVGPGKFSIDGFAGK